MKRFMLFCMLFSVGMALHAANNGDDSISTVTISLEQNSQEDDGWTSMGDVTLYHYCDCCNTCSGELSGETRSAELYVKEVTPGKLKYKVFFRKIYHYYAVAVFSHPSGYTIGRGTIVDWDFYLYL